MTQELTLNLDSVIQRNADVIDTTVDQDVVMVSVESGHYYGVSDVARDIWEAIGRPVRIGDLINRLAATYDVDRKVCEEQTLLFLESLRAEQLLEIRDERSP